MNFEVGKIYRDRKGSEYTYLRKSGNVLIFNDNKKEVCRNSSGHYRWDEQDTEVDIVE